jgi:hypothetical protein
MAFGTQSVIISNGIQAGPSFTLAQGLFVSVVSPATASSSASLRLTAGPPDQIEIGPSTTPHATVIGFGATVPVGGAGNQVVIGTAATTADTQDDVVIGHGAATGAVNAGNGSVAVGVSATVGGAGSNAGGGVAIGNAALANNGVAIGQGATCLTGQVAVGFGAVAVTFGIAVGGSATASFGGGHGLGSIAIGRSASASESTDIAIGTGNGGTAGGGGGNIVLASGVGGSGAQGHDSIVIGSSSNNGGAALPASATAAGIFSTVIGGNSQAQHSGARLLGRGLTSTAANQTLIGGTDDPCATVVWGNGAVAAAPQNVVEGVTGGSGLNVGGASYTIAGGIATGSGTGGSIIFRTSVVAGSSSTPQALATALTIDNTQTVTFAVAPKITATVATGAVTLGALTNAPGTATAASPPQAWGAIFIGATRYVMPLWTA